MEKQQSTKLSEDTGMIRKCGEGNKDSSPQMTMGATIEWIQSSDFWPNQ